MRARNMALLVALLTGPFGAGCGGGQTGGLTPALCGQVAVRALAPDEVSPVGPTAMELIDSVARDATTTIEWESGASSTIAVSVRASEGGEVSLVTTGPSGVCASFVEIDAVLSLISADGTLVASAPATLRVGKNGVVLRAIGLDASPVIARDDLRELGLDSLVEPDVVIDLDLSSDTPAGEISVRGQTCSAAPDVVGTPGLVGEDGNGGNGECTFSTVQVARIGPPEGAEER